MDDVKHPKQDIGVSRSPSTLVDALPHSRPGPANRHPLYPTWSGMRQRCLNPNSTRYKNYGGSGVRICDRWLNSFWAFCEDMGPRPSGTTLDRINPNGNYELANCRWATAEVQRDNKRIKRESLLSPRELQIVHMIAAGSGWKDAGEFIGINFSTVSTYRSRIYRKTGCCNSVQIGIWYAQNFPERCFKAVSNQIRLTP